MLAACPKATDLACSVDIFPPGLQKKTALNFVLSNIAFILLRP